MLSDMKINLLFVLKNALSRVHFSVAHVKCLVYEMAIKAIVFNIMHKWSGAHGIYY